MIINPSHQLSFPKIRSGRIRAVRKNQTIIQCDVCDHLPAWNIYRHLLKSRRRLEVENLFLRHQLNIILRRPRQRLRLRGSDRALMVWITRLWPSLLTLARVVQPATILRWHRAGFKTYWRWKSQGRPGRPRIQHELRNLIHRMSKENPLWGAPRIHGELLKLGFEVAESTVSKYMIGRRGSPSQSWRTFLRNHADAIAAIDLCVVPTLKAHGLRPGRRKATGRGQPLQNFTITSHTTITSIARQPDRADRRHRSARPVRAAQSEFRQRGNQLCEHTAPPQPRRPDLWRTRCP
jgi:hypothetical protein